MRRTDPNSPALRLLWSYVDTLRCEGPVADPVIARKVASHLSDLVALALGAAGDAAEIARGRGLRAARLSAIKSDIAASLTDPALSLGAIAARQGVTPRYVRMLFETEGMSFTEYVLGQRLYRAYRMLCDPSRTRHTIGMIAFESGFGDLSYFNRTFRLRFGETPSDIRRAAGGTADRTLQPPEIFPA
jgi:AraC-like DNA-binding protein